jgi:hypothetical protein
MPSGFRSVPSSDGARAKAMRAPTALGIFAALLWAIAASLVGFFQSVSVLGDPLSFQAARLGAKALKPQASLVWRDKSDQRRYGGRQPPKAEPVPAALQARILLATSVRLQQGIAPQRVSQSFLICRTRNPRDPPAA